jgi:hypothetical protein
MRGVALDLNTICGFADKETTTYPAIRAGGPDGLRHRKLALV